MNVASLPKTIAAYADIIDDVSDERLNDDGWWIYLKNGYRHSWMETHVVHEDTLKECAIQLKRDIIPCDCVFCKEGV